MAIVRGNEASKKQGSSGSTQDQPFNDGQLKILENKFQSFEEKINSFEQDVESFKNRTIEVLGIFAALFSFIAVDLQIFKNSTSIILGVGLTLILLGGLAFFVLALKYAFTSNFFANTTNKIIIAVLLIFIFATISSGIYFVNREANAVVITRESLNRNNDQFYNKGEVDFKMNVQGENFEKFKICLKGGGWNKCL